MKGGKTEGGSRRSEVGRRALGEGSWETEVGCLKSVGRQLKNTVKDVFVKKHHNHIIPQCYSWQSLFCRISGEVYK